MSNLNKFWICSFSLLMLTSCSPSKPPQAPPETMMPAEKESEDIEKAVATIYSTTQQSINAWGNASFKNENNGVHIVADFKGLKPGEHGIHIHQYGDCSQEGEAAGPHYSVVEQTHGAPNDSVHHRGDLGNITANQAGNAHYDQVLPDLKLHFILGRSIVVHEKSDDFKTQPSGNSGKRIACGIIGLAANDKVSKTN
jgi:superoxide dismutase, Cu-Zn family